MNATRIGKNSLLVLTLLVGASTFVAAQNTVSLSLNQAIEIAIQENRDLNIARLEIDNADAQVDEALGNAYPTLDFNARYTRNFKAPVQFLPKLFFSGEAEDTELVPVRFGSDNSLSADLSLQQVLFNSAVFTGVGTSKVYAKISRQQLRAQTAGLVSNITRAYYTALLAKEVLEVNQELLNNAEANYTDTKALFEAGLRAEFDAIRAEVAVENQRPMVVDAQNNYEAVLDNLKLLLGYSNVTQVKLELTESLARPASLDDSNPDLEELVRKMLANNPQIEALDLSTEVNRELISINKSEYLPTLALFANWRYDAQADNFGDLDFQPGVFAGLNLSLNIYNGGKTASKVEQARVSFDKTRFQVAQLQSALKTQLEGTLRRIEYARKRIAASDRTIEQAQRAYKIATTTYRAGTGTQLQINDADLALAQARLNQLNAVYDYNVAMADMESLLGENVRLVGDDVEYINN